MLVVIITSVAMFILGVFLGILMESNSAQQMQIDKYEDMLNKLMVRDEDIK